MKKLLAVLAVVVVFLSATSLRADLLGTKVSGSLTFSGGSTNFFDPANGFVPDGFGNSVSPNNVTIGSIVEFGYKDIFNRDTANFSNSTLVILSACSFSGRPCPFPDGPFEMKFTDTAFTSATLLINGLGVTSSFSGDTLTIDFPGGNVSGERSAAVFRIDSAAAQTPEPGSIALVASGLLGAAGAIRRRFIA